MKKYKLLGAPCLLVESVDDAKTYIKDLIRNGKGGYSVAINAEKIMMYEKRPEMKMVVDGSILPTPDGAGAVLGFKFIHKKRAIKLDLPKTIFQLATTEKYSMFILGAKEDSNEKATEKLKKLYPDINLVGRRNGYFDSEDEITDLLIKANPQIVMLALGSPKQEIFAEKFNKKLPGTLFIGCGGALDILAGKAKRAPKFFIENNLEWFYRLVKEPGRIYRQLILPVFLLKLLIYSIFRRKNK
jgi:N-acetylglucosaminyldiphosphoundecaprenol N-acetyl-beta-D-mannosaminyltransferase